MSQQVLLAFGSSCTFQMLIIFGLYPLGSGGALPHHVSTGPCPYTFLRTPLEDCTLLPCTPRPALVIHMTPPCEPPVSEDLMLSVEGQRWR